MGIDFLYASERQAVCLKAFAFIYNSITTDGFSKERNFYLNAL